MICWWKNLVHGDGSCNPIGHTSLDLRQVIQYTVVHVSRWRNRKISQAEEDAAAKDWHLIVIGTR